MRSGEEDNGLSGKCFTAPELAHQKSENVGGTPEPFPLLAFTIQQKIDVAVLTEFNGRRTLITVTRFVLKFIWPIVRSFNRGLSKYFETAVSSHQNCVGGKHAQAVFVRWLTTRNGWSWPAVTFWWKLDFRLLTIVFGRDSLMTQFSNGAAKSMMSGQTIHMDD